MGGDEKVSQAFSRAFRQRPPAHERGLVKLVSNLFPPCLTSRSILFRLVLARASIPARNSWCSDGIFLDVDITKLSDCHWIIVGTLRRPAVK